MTLLGKIFTVLIFIMSVVFMSFTVMVYATHTNWKKVAINPKAGDPNHDENYPPGLVHAKKQLEDANVALAAEMQAVLNDLEKERAARAMAIQHLESINLARGEELASATKDRDAEIAKNSQLQEALRSSQTERNAKAAEAKQLRIDIQTAEADRDVQFREVVALTDKLFQNEGARTRLEERSEQLALQVVDMKRVMDQMGITVHTPIHNIPPKPLDGYVTDVSTTTGGTVEISLGSDDGLRVGHELVVFRNNSYLARIIIRKVDTNFAVAEVIKEFAKGAIRKGDNVTTRLS